MNYCPYLKNLCFASISNLLMNCCKAFSPDSLWGSIVQTNISENAISESISWCEVALTKCCIGHSVRTLRRFYEFQHTRKNNRKRITKVIMALFN